MKFICYTCVKDIETDATFPQENMCTGMVGLICRECLLTWRAVNRALEKGEAHFI